ncbi:MAG TPA: squalene synthase HpnC [Streptosporangiaceae bacterium]|nr:squalene synthase HpnC [Streptosporangiaceae bacterium]
MAGGGRGTRVRAHASERVERREHVRPSITRADEVLANTAGENFPVALRMLPARTRRRLFALYCFARFTDDLGDQAEVASAEVASAEADDSRAGKATADLRLGLLDELEADIDRIYRGEQPRTPALRPLRQTIAECAIPEQPFRDLIEANRQDQRVTRYQTYQELEHYCTLSANPVGVIVLYIFGVATPGRIALSDNICTALQLVEHWQDVAEDLRDKGRIYLPQDDMARFGVSEDDLRRPHVTSDVRALLAFEATRARGLLETGASLTGTLRGAARLAVAGYVAGGRAALAAIERQHYDVLASTPKATKPILATRLARTYVRGR